MSEGVKEVQDSGFAEAIRSGVVLVDFWAPRCGPCRMQTPILEAVAGVVGDQASIVKLNVDENPAATEQYGIQSIPTLIVFKDGKAIQQFVGLQRKEELVSVLGRAAAL